MRLPMLCAAALAALTSAAASQTFDSSSGKIKVETVAQGLEHPWSLQFLPDGNMLVTERPGRMRIVSRDGKLGAPLGQVPKPYVGGQAGLLDIALDHQYPQNHMIYFCYSADRSGNANVASAKLVTDETPHLDEVKTIFRQVGPGGANNHGCRIAQAMDGNLFVTLGDHFGPREAAQDLATDNGKIVRITPNGAVPPDNPFVGRASVRTEIWSFGHRNPQGLTFNPTSGKLWEIEHGPRGGDEVNIIKKGANYGWPVIGYGIDYSGAKIHDATSKTGMEQPLKYWVPSIAPSGMAFYQGDLFPTWRGHLFVGALAGEMLVRLTIDGDTVLGEERLLHPLRERIRDVRTGPDGALYLLTDNSAGRILRVTPAQ